MKLSTFELLKNSQSEGGFYLSDSQLKTLQNTLLMILTDISSLAEQNGIPLYLGSGTVLGAIRHKGFIPWDDDIDVNIERRFYDDFIALMRRERSDTYWIHTPETTHNYGILSTRIRMKGTSVRLREDDYSDEHGVCLDVFPIENTFDNTVLRILQGMLCMGTGFLLSCRKFYRDREKLKNLFHEQRLRIYVYYIKSAIGFLVSWGDVDFWTHAVRNANSVCKNNQSRFVSVPAGRGHFFKELYVRKDFCGKEKRLFEGKAFYCTSDPDSYMKALYGDSYMQIPPKEKREKHMFFSFSIPDAEEKESLSKG